MTPALLHDPFRPGETLVHRLDARVKVALALGFILATAVTPAGAWPMLVLLAGIAAAGVILAELRAGFVLTRVLVVLPFALAAVPLIFTVPGRPLFDLPWGWTASQEGLTRAVTYGLKTGLSVIVALCLTVTTRFAAILVVLRGWGLPKLLVSILALTWRYLFVLVEEASRLMRAREARSGRIPGMAGGSLAWRARVTGGMAGNLLLRGTDRAERIYGAMASRGYDGEPRVLAQPPLTRRSRALLVGGLVSLALLTLSGLLVWG